jgi:hypothetical protein
MLYRAWFWTQVGYRRGGLAVVQQQGSTPPGSRSIFIVAYNLRGTDAALRSQVATSEVAKFAPKLILLPP